MRPLLLGHRGARSVRRLGTRSPGAPTENTVAAFDYALAHGCDGFEFDVRYTRDHRCVLCHDPEHHGKKLAETDYADFAERSSSGLCCLEDILKRFGPSAYLNIELKVAGNEESVLLAIHANPPQRGFVVSSFLPQLLHRLHEIHSPLPLGYICKDPEEAELWTKLPIRFLVPHYSLVTKRLVREVHARGLQLITWTVNRQTDLLRLAGWGVDGLISDDPKLLAATFPTTIAAGAL